MIYSLPFPTIIAESLSSFLNICSCEFQYNRGRASNRSSWVFGMLGIKDDKRRPILKIVRHRSTRHLLPLIKKHVHRGSCVISDGWRSYRCLQDEGYNHLTVNHQDVFVDPVTGAHTQNLERFWGICKSTIWRQRGNRTQKLLRDHLDVIEWTYWRENHHSNGTLGMLLHDIRKKFPVWNLSEMSSWYLYTQKLKILHKIFVSFLV